MFEVSEKPVSNGRCGTGDQALFLLDLAQLEDLDCSSQLQKQSFLFLFCSESGRERKENVHFPNTLKGSFINVAIGNIFILQKKILKRFSPLPQTLKITCLFSSLSASNFDIVLIVSGPCLWPPATFTTVYLRPYSRTRIYVLKIEFLPQK